MKVRESILAVISALLFGAANSHADYWERYGAEDSQFTGTAKIALKPGTLEGQSDGGPDDESGLNGFQWTAFSNGFYSNMTGVGRVSPPSRNARIHHSSGYAPLSTGSWNPVSQLYMNLAQVGDRNFVSRIGSEYHIVVEAHQYGIPRYQNLVVDGFGVLGFFNANSFFWGGMITLRDFEGGANLESFGEFHVRPDVTTERGPIYSVYIPDYKIVDVAVDEQNRVYALTRKLIEREALETSAEIWDMPAALCGFRIYRFDSSGQPDLEFGEDSDSHWRDYEHVSDFADLEEPHGCAAPFRMILTSAGQLVVAGRALSETRLFDENLFLLSTDLDGEPNHAFGGGFRIYPYKPPGAKARLKVVTLDEDAMGNLIVGGRWERRSGIPVYALLSATPHDGRPRTGFGFSGNGTRVLEDFKLVDLTARRELSLTQQLETAGIFGVGYQQSSGEPMVISLDSRGQFGLERLLTDEFAPPGSSFIPTGARPVYETEAGYAFYTAFHPSSIHIHPVEDTVEIVGLFSFMGGENSAPFHFDYPRVSIDLVMEP